MKNLLFGFLFIWGICSISFGQQKCTQRWYAGYKTYQLIDSSSIYKPQSADTDNLHYRPVNFEVWYPSDHTSTDTLSFGELLGAYEQSAKLYQEGKEYKGMLWLLFGQ